MGLDITAYEKVELHSQDLPQDEAWDGGEDLYEAGLSYDVVWNGIPFPDRCAPLIVPEKGKGNVYVCTGREIDFRAGSYGGYGAFRELLCKIANLPEPREQWQNRDEYQGAPFFELVNFSDCEGVIGATACAELAADFAAFQWHADRMAGDWLETYNNWRNAFELARNGGCVRFH